MKKSIIVLSAMAMVFFTSCDEKKENVEEKIENNSEVDATVNNDEEVVSDVDVASDVEAASGTPSFDNEQLQEFVNSYEEYMNDYKEAMESMDMEKVQALSAKGQELASKSQGFTDLSAEDTKKLTEYMEVKSKEMMEIANQAAK